MSLVEHDEAVGDREHLIHDGIWLSADVEVATQSGPNRKIYIAAVFAGLGGMLFGALSFFPG